MFFRMLLTAFKDVSRSVLRGLRERFEWFFQSVVRSLRACFEGSHAAFGEVFESVLRGLRACFEGSLSGFERFWRAF